MRGALLLGVLAAVGIMLAPSTASAQITPTPGVDDFCANSSSLGTTPSGNFNVSIVGGSGTVSAAMQGTQADCIRPPSTCSSPNCQIVVTPVCEFHCSHNHSAPYPWPVRFTATNSAAGSFFVGWGASCEPNRNVDRRDCVLRWTSTQPNVNLTAYFSQQQDSQPPAPAPSLGATPESYAVSLSWTPSVDPEQWLAGYDIFRNGTRVARVRPGTTSYKAQNLLCRTSYTFRVDAFDWSGNEARSLDVATTTGACLSGGSTGPRPNTVIHVKPPKVTRKRTAYFHFGSGAVRATKYQCKLDRRAWRRCSGSAGKTYRRLKPGYHIFRVRAGNANGWDPTPARYRWRIRR